MNEQKRYTAQEMRDQAEFISTERGGVMLETAAMLRQAADAEEELANLKTTSGELEKRALEYADQVVSSPLLTNTIKRLIAERNSLKARLDAVVKECERINDETFERSINKVVAYKTRVDVTSDAICHRILRAARGEGGAE